MSTTVPDLQNMPLDELKRLTVQFEAGELPVVEPEVAPVVPAVEPPVVEPEKKRFRREIDLEDGSGKQVFEGATLDELVENLAKAQKNATKKIREQAAELRAKETPAVPAKKLSLEERLDAFEKRDQWNAAQNEFVAAHPEYDPSAANGQRIIKYMQMENLPQTSEGIERAFNELTALGFIAAKNAPAVTEVTEPTTEQRIAAPENGTVKVSPGLTARTGSLAARAAKEELTEKDIKSLSTEELRKKTREHFESQ
jgi:hypothetical protein